MSEFSVPEERAQKGVGQSSRPDDDDSNVAVVETPISDSSAGTRAKPNESSAAAIDRGSTPSPSESQPPRKIVYSSQDARNELTKLHHSGKISAQDTPAIKAIIQDHFNLKEKVDKLKSLLGRSAKAQRETKVDLEATQKRLSQALREIERLNQKLDKLQSRPTHMDMLSDFAVNFDRALLSVQSGGEETTSTPTTKIEKDQSALDSMLLEELSETKARVEKLETLNSALMTRSGQMESTMGMLQKERDEIRQNSDRLKMELKMAQMEAEHATRLMQDKAASLEEMQMEINLVTKANAKAHIRAAKGEEVVNSLKSDRQRIQQLESQVKALEEWAQASAESKRLIQERCIMLESKLKQSQTSQVDENSDESVLISRNGSLIIGAGDKDIAIVELGQISATQDTRFVVLRWKFDCEVGREIGFSILKGKCHTATAQKKADYLIKDRLIVSGAGGETEGAFNNVDSACTLLWANSSWIRPRTVKYSVDVVALK